MSTLSARASGIPALGPAPPQHRTRTVLARAGKATPGRGERRWHHTRKTSRSISSRRRRIRTDDRLGGGGTKVCAQPSVPADGCVLSEEMVRSCEFAGVSQSCAFGYVCRQGSLCGTQRWRCAQPCSGKADDGIHPCTTQMRPRRTRRRMKGAVQSRTTTSSAALGQ